MMNVMAMQILTLLLHSGPATSGAPAAKTAAGAGFAVVWCLFMLVIFALSIGLLIFWIWILIDCIQNEPSEGNDKVVWILVIVLLGGVGGLVYLFVRRPQRKQLYGK